MKARPRPAAACARLALALAIALPGLARAAGDDAARVRARMAAPVAEQVLAIVGEAKAAGLPAEPLVGRALEGASRQADGAAIVIEVRRYAAAMVAARTALGAASGVDEITSGASALLAGVPADSLARLRAARTGTLTIPLLVLCDFVARGVPLPAASGTVIAAARAKASDAGLMRLRARVHERIEQGGAPDAAARDVLRSFLRSPGRDIESAPAAPPRGGHSP